MKAKRGEKEANTPNERPNAILCGLSCSLFILWLKYSMALRQPLLEKIVTLDSLG